MSNIKLGKNTKLRLGRTSTADKTDVTGVGQGTDSISRGRTIDTATRPGGRGRTITALGNFVTHDFGVSAMTSHAVHDGLLRDAFGQRLHGDYREEGDADGKPVATFQAVVATLTLSFNHDDDSVSWGMTCQVDGKPTETTQS